MINQSSGIGLEAKLVLCVYKLTLPHDYTKVLGSVLTNTRTYMKRYTVYRGREAQ